MGPRENRWGWLALVLSVVAHLAAALWLWRQPEVVEPPRLVTAEFIFNEPAPEPEQPPEPPPEPEKAPEPKPSPRPKAVVVAPPQPPPPTKTENTGPPPSDVPRADRPGAEIDEAPVTPRLNLGLVPDSTLVLRLDAGVEPEVVMKTGLRGLEAPKNLVGELTKETLGRGRVDRGLVHPYYSQLGKALLKNWDADRVAKSGLKGLVEQTGENLKLYNELWADRAAAYGRSANPMGDVTPDNNRRAAVNDRVGGGVTGVDLEQRKELARTMRETFRATRRAVIRVVQDTDGKVTKIELVQPSNDSNVDKEAMNDVRTAAQKLPPPPAEALDGKSSLSSLWSFELVVSISPPVPTFTFEFDEALGFIDARLPLDRRIYKKVRLVAVE